MRAQELQTNTRSINSLREAFPNRLTVVHKQDAIISQLTALSLCSASFGRNVKAGTLQLTLHHHGFQQLGWSPQGCLISFLYCTQV